MPCMCTVGSLKAPPYEELLRRGIPAPTECRRRCLYSVCVGGSLWFRAAQLLPLAAAHCDYTMQLILLAGPAKL